MFGLAYNATDSFFDRPKVMEACKTAGRQNLGRAGAHVRTAARDLLRKSGAKRGRPVKGQPRKRDSAKPGEPPRKHEGGLRDGVWFAYDFAHDSVVAGPVRYNGDQGAVPGLLEHGGTITRTIKVRGHRFRKTLRYHKFPYMGPALERVAPTFPNLWANTVRDH